MYKVYSIYDGCDKSVVTSTCMYEMPLIYQTAKSNACEPIQDNSFTENAAKDLLSRQQLMSQRIINLQKQIDVFYNEFQINSISSVCVTKRDTRLQQQQRVEQQRYHFDNNALNLSVKPIKHNDLVLFADTTRIPVSLFVMIDIMKKSGLKVLVNIHYHSSINIDINAHLRDLTQSLSNYDISIQSDKTNSIYRSDYHIIVTLIFKRTDEPLLVFTPIKSIRIAGEINILRFMVRFGSQFITHLNKLYDGIDDYITLTLVNNLIDELNGANDDIYLKCENMLKTNENEFLFGETPTIADIMLYGSIINHSTNTQNLPFLANWVQKFKKHQNF